VLKYLLFTKISAVMHKKERTRSTWHCK